MLSAKQLDQIGKLISKYEALPGRERHAYQETEVRTNFIDRLFEALGWPVHDRAHVERETTVLEGKRPDYSFKIDGIPRLFLEAKAFRADIYDREETRKAITKAYNKGVPWIGVTNFERFVLYDAQEELTASLPRRVFDLSYGDYLNTQLEAGIDLLTPEAVQGRALEDYAQRTGARRRVVPIEKRLYQSLRGWRENLFNALYQIKQWKTEAEFHEGDEAIQRLLDRLIFLRNCEDRGIGGTDLRGLRNRIRQPDRGLHVTQALLRLFNAAADTYDSELFQTYAIIDVLMQGMGTVLDEPLSQIVEELYSVPRSYSDYDFSQMEPDVLGEVYEQYLGYVPQRVRKLSAQAPVPGMDAERITLEAKRQRRKEHGVYYTPRWVVQYIVEQALGRFLEENRERPDAIDDVTVLDPACGSGSFLIRAYETLLEHHAALMGGDIGHLDTHTRERILRRSIYGVDLDPQAVEIARLNLLIRMVRQQELLPELKANIQHGNSLIEGGEDDLRPFFGDAWEEKQAFNWAQRFPQVMERGGFDIIIGNPPYVRIQTLARDDADYFRRTFESAYGSFDIYVLFIEQGLRLLKDGGRLGFITSGKFLKSDYGKRLCGLLSRSATIEEVADLSSLQVFAEATTYPIILVVRKVLSSLPLKYTPVDEIPLSFVATSSVAEGSFNVDQSALLRGIWPPSVGQTKDLIERLEASGPRLEQMAPHIFQGLVTSADKVYTLHCVDAGPDTTVVKSRATGRQHSVENAVLKTLVDGKALSRYLISPGDKLLLFPYDISADQPRLLPAPALSSKYPLAWDYLCQNKLSLEGRETGKMEGDSWYGYVYPKNLALHSRRKLVVPRLVVDLSAAYDPSGLYYLDNVDVGGIILEDDSELTYLNVLAVLNSKAGNYYFRQRSVPFRGNYRSANRQFLAPIPIPHPYDKGTVAQSAALARRMLDLHQRLAATGEMQSYDREQIEREIASTDGEIDSLVYDLYGLTAKERALVEASVRR